MYATMFATMYATMLIMFQCPLVDIAGPSSRDPPRGALLQRRCREALLQGFNLEP